VVNSPLGRIVRGVLWLGLVSLAACGTGEYVHQLPDGTPTGSAIGVVRHVTSGLPLAGVKVTLSRDGKNLVSGYTDERGLYQFLLESGVDYALRFETPYFLGVSYKEINVKTDELQALQPVVMVPNRGEGNAAILQGSVRAASGGAQALPDVAVSLRPGMNNTQDEPLVTAATDSDGNYYFDNLPNGSYTLELQGLGFAPAFYSLVAVSGGLDRDGELWLSPEDLSTGQARIVLSWETATRDLDAYVSGPVAEKNQRFMIFYSQYNSPQAQLDLQQTTVETAQLYGQTTGSYYFAVGDFTVQQGHRRRIHRWARGWMCIGMIIGTRYFLPRRMSRECAGWFLS